MIVILILGIICIFIGLVLLQYQGVKKDYSLLKHYAIVSKKDKSGRFRYNFYLEGKLVKEDITIEGWIKYKEPNNVSIY